MFLLLYLCRVYTHGWLLSQQRKKSQYTWIHKYYYSIDKNQVIVFKYFAYGHCSCKQIH